MSKRVAGSKLDHDNWDEEEDSEEAGHFATAKKEVLAKREIKKAKRKVAASEENENGEPKPAFKAFTGFSFSAQSSTGSFNFKPMSNGNTSAPTLTTTTTATSANSGGSASDSANASMQNSKYLHQLKNLNQSVNKWITEHVDKNPYCILSPIFKDYEKHLEDLEKKYPDHSKAKPSEKKPEEISTKLDPVTSPPSTFTFGVASKPAVATDDSSANQSAAAKPAFSFGSKGESTGSTGIFGGASVGGSGFSFAVNKPAETAASNDAEEEYVPPKAEVTTVEETDAFYTKRCKLYYKKGESWADRGVGNLHLKKVDDKSVLLVRADTNLGNILLNIQLRGVPVTRQGKNNVMIMCVPNPPLDENSKQEVKPVGMLIRVKTGEDADELYSKMKECQGDA